MQSHEISDSSPRIANRLLAGTCQRALPVYHYASDLVVQDRFPVATQMSAYACLGDRQTGIRVALCEPDAAIRAQLRMAIAADPVLMLAGELANWAECQACIEEWVPELLIARSDLIPHEWRSRRHALTALPVVIALRPATTFPHPGRRYNDLRVPADAPAIKAALDRAVSEVYERKAKELAYLIDCYVTGSQHASPYKKTIVVEQDGKAVEVSVSQILSVVAARKQVEIQSTQGQFKLREPIHQVEEKLDPRWFVRIHRSVIVNLQYVREGLQERASTVLLTDGSRHPVGPNYREALAEALRGSFPSTNFSAS